MKWLSSLIILLSVLTGCLESEYSKLVKAELAEEVKQDSLLLGISFGDTQKEFYEKCFLLNKKMLVSQGPDNSSVEYVFTDSAFHSDPMRIRLLFYPGFDEKRIIKNMDLEFSYSGWAPWNKRLQSDSLKNKVLDILYDWYGGNQFITVNIDDKQLPVKVDANRRMMVFIKDPQTVVVQIQDILHPVYKHSISR